MRLLALLLLASCAHRSPGEIAFTSSMFETARLGIGTANHHLERSKIPPNLALLGPFEGFQGEVTILDGKAYHSKALEGAAVATEVQAVRTVFNVRSECKDWKPLRLSAAKDLGELEELLRAERPYFFRMRGQAEKLLAHIVTGVEPDSKKVQKIFFHLDKTNLTFVGVYSQKHRRIFTHHDRDSHIHAIDVSERTYHVDNLSDLRIRSAEVCDAKI